MAFREWVKPYLFWIQRAWLFTVMTTVTCYGVYHGWQLLGLTGALGYGLLALMISPLLASPEILLLVLSA